MKKYYLIIALLYLLLPLLGSGQIPYDGVYNSSSELLYAGMDNHPSDFLLEHKPVDEKIAFTKSENTVYAKPAVTSNANDLFRSNVVSGNWNNIASWESSSDGGASWAAATLIPTSAAQTITVRSGHIIIVNTSISLDETIIEGTLELQTGSVLNIDDGAGADIDVLNDGVINVKNSSSNSYATIINQAVNASVNIATNGKIVIIGNGLSVATGLHGFATNASNVWNNGAVFEWNCDDDAPALSGSNTFFSTAGPATIPVFRITQIGNGGIIGTGSGAFVVNGLLDLQRDVIFTESGSKTFRDGISSNSFTVDFPSSIGTLTISSPNAVLAGNLNIILNKQLNLTTGLTIPTGSTVIIDNTSGANIEKGTNGIFKVEAGAIFDIGYNSSMSNASGSVNISGTFRTGNINGFTGTGSSLPTLSGVINLNAGCTVELNRYDGTGQDLTSRADFKNIIFSGNGTKSLSSACNPAGTVLIKDDAILDIQNNTFGNSGTALTMTGGRFRLSGASLKPDMEGVYNLTGGVIEFYNSAGGNQTINGEYGAGTPIEYNQIEVTGSNVANSNTNITLKSGGTFSIKNGGVFEINADAIVGPLGIQTVTVENGGTFKCGDIHGFSNGTGATATSVHQNIETINLQPGSTVEYIRAGDQNITNLFNISSNLSYQNLVIKGSGNKTAPSSTLEIRGNLSGSGTASFVHNNGTVLMSAITAQNYTAVNPFTFYDFINSNTEGGSGLSIQNDLSIVNGLTLSNGSNLELTAGDINLVSDNTKTAYVDKVVGSVSVSYGTGKFVVQRYLPIAATSAARRWRLLTAPLKTNNAPTINAAWQEGQSNSNRLSPSDDNPGFGTIITRGTTASNGYDQGSTGNPSIFKYTGGNWTPLPGTNSGAITDELGYMIFVRGNRNMIVSNPFVVGSPTTLRAKGEINIGSVSILLDPAGFKLIGNPYASAISFNDVLVNGVDPSTNAGVTFYLWDPKFSGNYNVGGFVTCTSLGNGFYSVSANGSGYVNAAYDGVIESGTAFMVPASSGNVVFNENCKLTSSSTVGIASRPAGNNGSNTAIDFFTANLLSGSDSASKVLDGVINAGSNDFENIVNEKDAPKLISFQTAEKLSILREDKKLSIELRKKLTDNDTVFYYLSKLNKSNYQFEFIKKSIDSSLTAILEDSFTGQQTILPADDSVYIPFSITADSASFAAGRFRVVFKSSVKYNLVSATVVKNDIEVKWQVVPEYNISHYEIERSSNGILFNTLDLKQGIGNSNTVLNYDWLDKTPTPGIYYYRIKAVTINGAVLYSDIVKVKIVSSGTDLYVFPNPVTEKTIQLQLNDKPAGKYFIRLINSLGQTLTRGIINHPGGTATQIIKPASLLPDGIYSLEVISPDTKITSIKLVVKE